MLSVKVIIDNNFARVFNFLKRNAKEFDPPLDRRVDLSSYSKKLSANAQNIFFVEGVTDVGHAAVYINDKKSNTAFLSSICIDPDYRGRGLARRLLQEVLKGCAHEGMHLLELEVATKNESALSFYRNAGFRADAQSGDQLLMSLPIENAGYDD